MNTLSRAVLAVHPHLDVGVLERFCESGSHELAALTSVHDRRFAVACDRLCQRSHAVPHVNVNR